LLDQGPSQNGTDQNLHGLLLRCVRDYSLTIILIKKRRLEASF
jgi:hypothetical protein